MSTAINDWLLCITVSVALVLVLEYRHERHLHELQAVACEVPLSPEMQALVDKYLHYDEGRR